MLLSDAIAHIDRGLAMAKELGVAISIAVVDEFGQLVQLDRMDGAALMSPDIAEAKAITALNFSSPTSKVAKLDADTLRSIGAVVPFSIVAIAGGVVIVDGSKVMGAIGVSGASSRQDEDIANYAMARS